MKRRSFFNALALSTALALALGRGAGAQAKTIKVGVLHSLSGTMAISETVLKDIALMTFDEINAKGGVMGYKIEAVGRRSGVELAAVRREGAQLHHAGQGRGRVRLLDIGVAQVACCRCSRS